MRKTSSGKLTRTRRSSLDVSSGGRNCGVQARAEEKEKAAEEDALSPVEKVLLTPPKTMTTTPASMEKEKEYHTLTSL